MTHAPQPTSCDYFQVGDGFQWRTRSDIPAENSNVCKDLSMTQHGNLGDAETQCKIHEERRGWEVQKRIFNENKTLKIRGAGTNQ